MKLFSVYMLAIFTTSFVYAQEAKVSVKLSPAGSFIGKTNQVKGVVQKSGDGFSAQNIIVSLKSLKTGIELRDQHTLKHLEVEKYPEAVLVKAGGSGGKGSGIIRIKGIEKNISGTYTVSGQKIKAEFPLLLSDFKITGIKYMGVGVKDQVTVEIEVPVK